MYSAGTAYGLYSLREWERRLATPGRPGIWDLSDTKCAPGSSCLTTTRQVGSFEELINVVAFLAVMNKGMTLLFRGQTRDYPVLPSLLRRHWKPPDAPEDDRVDLESDREHYWDQLRTVEHLTLHILKRHGVPRWRHLEEYRYARWPIIQHYELWPTPMIDFSTSLRVATSFAFGLDCRAEKGFLYIAGISQLRSDLMTLRDSRAHELQDGMLAIRLNSVCPPKVIRPHLQEGVLVCSYPLTARRAVGGGTSPAKPELIARIELANTGNFWSDDFPIHTEGALLPDKKKDALLSDLRDEIRYVRDIRGTFSIARGAKSP